MELSVDLGGSVEPRHGLSATNETMGCPTGWAWILLAPVCRHWVNNNLQWPRSLLWSIVTLRVAQATLEACLQLGSHEAVLSSDGRPRGCPPVSELAGLWGL